MEDKGGTMRLGLYPATLTPGSKAAAVYGTEVIYERHRHRFEVNNRYRAMLEGAGMILSGQSPDGRLVEIVELRDHPWFVASQFHPEFKSRAGPAAPALRWLRRERVAVAGGRELMPRRGRPADEAIPVEDRAPTHGRSPGPDRPDLARRSASAARGPSA